MRYGEFLKESLKLDKMEEELRRWEDLSKRLVFVDDGVYGSHPITGIVYDVRIIDKNISILQSNIQETKERIDA